MVCQLRMTTCTEAHLSVEFWNDLFQLVEHCVGLGAIDVVAKLVLWPAEIVMSNNLLSLATHHD